MSEKNNPNLKIELRNAPNCEVRPVTGAYGGFGANDLLRVNFHYDDLKVGVRLEDGKEVLETEGMLREVQARLVMNPQAAVSITMWLVRTLAERGLLKNEPVETKEEVN